MSRHCASVRGMAGYGVYSVVDILGRDELSSVNRCQPTYSGWSSMKRDSYSFPRLRWNED